MFSQIKAPRRGLTSGGVTQAVAASGRRAGLGVVHAHRLRHSAATAMQRRGVASDATFRVRREDGGARPAGSGGRSGDRDDRANPQAGTAVTGRSCVRCQDVASTLVASDARIVR